MATQTEQIDIVIEAINKASAEFNKIKQDLGGLSTAAKGTKGGFAALGENLDKVGKKLSSVGTKLTIGLTIPLVALGKKAVETSIKFERSMVNAFSVMGDVSQDTRKELTAFARTLGKETAFSAGEAADAIYKLGSAGRSSEEIMGSLTGIMDVAAATHSDLADVAEQSTIAMTVFGIASNEAERVTDSFVAGITNSTLNFDRLKNSMVFAGSTMAGFGKSIEETVGGLAVFANAGVFGEKAGTGLRNILADLAAPTSHMKGALADLGISMEELNPETKSLGEIFQRLQDSNISAGEAMEIFGKRSGPLVLATLKAAEEAGVDAIDMFEDMEKEMGITGIASDVASEQLDTVSGQLLILKSSIEEVYLSFVQSALGDTLKGYVKGLIEFVNKIGELDPTIQQNIVVFGAFLAALGPILLIVGKLVSAYGVLAASFAKGGAMLALFSNPITWVVAAFVGLIAVFSQTEDGMEQLGTVVDSLKQLWEGLQPVISAIVQVLIDNLLPVLENIATTIMPIVIDVFNSLVDILEPVLGIVAELLPVFGNFAEVVANLALGPLSFMIKGLQVLKPLLIIIESLFWTIKVVLEVTIGWISSMATWVGDLILKFTDWIGVTDEVNAVIDWLAQKMEALIGWIVKAVDWMDQWNESNRAMATIQSEAAEYIKANEASIAKLTEGMQTASDVEKIWLEQSIKLLKQDSEAQAELAEGNTKAYTKIREEMVKTGKEMEEYSKTNQKELTDIGHSFENLDINALEAFKSVGGGLSETANEINGLKKVAEGDLSAVEEAYTEVGNASAEAGTASAEATADVSASAQTDLGNAAESWTGYGDTVSNVTTETSATVEREISISTAQASTWGAHFVQNFTAGVNSAKPALIASISSIKAELEAVKFSTNPDIPSEKWGLHFIDNFSGGIEEGIPELEDSISDINNTLFGVADAVDGVTRKVRRTDIFKTVREGVDDLKAQLEGLSKKQLEDVTKQFDDLGNSLQDLGEKGFGPFAITIGGEVVDSFSSIEEGAQKLEEQLLELSDSSAAFTKQAEEIAIALTEGNVDDVVDSYDDLEDILNDVASEVEDLNDTHEEFVQNAKDELDGFADKISEIKKEFAELADEISASTAVEASGDLIAALEDRADLEKELIELQQKLNQESDPDRRGDIQKDIQGIRDEITAIDDLAQQYDDLSTRQRKSSNELDEINKRLERLQEISIEKGDEVSTKTLEEINILQERRNELLRDQKIVGDILSKSEEERADLELKNSNTALEYSIIKGKEALKQNELMEQQALKTAEELNQVYQAIAEGRVAELDVAEFGEEAKKLQEEALLEQEVYQGNLDVQNAILQEAQDKEIEIRENTISEIESQQTALQAFLFDSYDAIIVKLKAVEQAAKAALAAKLAAAGSGGAFVGGQFAGGGYTGSGDIHKVAGVVHKGEWVAPNWMVKSFRPMFAQLENMRRGRIRGFEEGGEVGGSAITNNNMPITMNNVVNNEMDFNDIARNFAWNLQTSGGL